MEIRLTRLENAFTLIRRDVDELRGDVRDIKEKVGSIECVVARLDQKFDGLVQQLGQFPTKLQIAAWVCVAGASLLAVVVSLLAFLLRLYGHPAIAKFIDITLGN